MKPTLEQRAVAYAALRTAAAAMRQRASEEGLDGARVSLCEEAADDLVAVARWIIAKDDK